MAGWMIVKTDMYDMFQTDVRYANEHQADMVFSTYSEQCHALPLPRH
jgi:hypothetical protein